MRLHRFFIESDLSGRKEIKITGRELTDQVRKVLRLSVGDELVFFDGRGNEALAEIKELEKNLLAAAVKGISRNRNEPDKKITLYCALLKKENFEWAVQKAVETGAARIVPLRTERTVKLDCKKERLEKIIREAAEQSGRGILPALGEIMDFAEAMEDAEDNDTKLLFDRSGEKSRKTDGAETVGIFIGPEGGWTEHELELAKKNRLSIISLGRLVFRAETAAILACYAINQKT